ncbi:MAG TPA: MoaD/ThiS family protein [Humibacillus xanthopallidus]|nr:MoaD/ThiS family protein [Humibacillus xanthopallidus]
MTAPQTQAAVTVRYWAAARAAAGVDEQTLELAVPTTVGVVVDAAVAAHPALARVARVATFLLDGRSVGRDAPVADGASLEVLPPFAGG